MEGERAWACQRLANRNCYTAKAAQTARVPVAQALLTSEELTHILPLSGRIYSHLKNASLDSLIDLSYLCVLCK